jgi:hypothetical protein
MSTTIGALCKKPPREKRRFPIEQDIRYQCTKGRQLFALV